MDEKFSFLKRKIHSITEFSLWISLWKFSQDKQKPDK
uniref:Uncharacterized protein n=1 Tax=uncultured Desulfobacterium sp. TaxID=201089 RepID=E1YCN7_9BACT|nr:unknown protein [uncultured Desulfobacterium sp.]